MLFHYLTLSLIATLAASVHADCNAESAKTMDVSGHKYEVGKVVTDKELCLSQGDGDWTFAMITTMGTSGVQFGEGDSPVASYSSGTAFLVLDNTCTAKGLFGRPQCGLPWAIRGNFMKYIGSVINVYTGIEKGETYFKYLYGDGTYAVGDNGAVCSNMKAPGLSAVKGCRAAFPVNGTHDKKPSKEVLDFTNLFTNLPKGFLEKGSSRRATT